MNPKDRIPHHCTVAIIGGGLAGLNAARLLHRAGVDFHLFEARERLGGRILTVNADGKTSEDGFDLGPSWFWPRMQPAIGTLVAELGLPSFAQSSDGDMVFERTSREPPQRYPGFRQEQESMRLVGGTTTLIRALAQDVPAARFHLGTPVSALAFENGKVTLTLPARAMTANHVVAALPPRVMQANLSFVPALSSETDRLWRDTPTWMAPHAKFFALYDRPFWLAAGYSGTAQSMVGPMPEIHDATSASGEAALFGFLGIGAAERQRLGEATLTNACIAQFVRIFGLDAARPRATLYKDWAADPLTATPADWTSSDHPSPAAEWIRGPWGHVLSLAGSETSPSDAGYLAGAVEASATTVASLLARLAEGPP